MFWKFHCRSKKGSIQSVVFSLFQKKTQLTQCKRLTSALRSYWVFIQRWTGETTAYPTCWPAVTSAASSAWPGRGNLVRRLCDQFLKIIISLWSYANLFTHTSHTFFFFAYGIWVGKSSRKLNLKFDFNLTHKGLEWLQAVTPTRQEPQLIPLV